MGITLYVLTFFVNPFSDIEDTIQGPLAFPQVVSEGIVYSFILLVLEINIAYCKLIYNLSFVLHQYYTGTLHTSSKPRKVVGTAPDLSLRLCRIAVPSDSESKGTESAPVFAHTLDGPMSNFH